MDKKAALKLIESLSNANGPSGYEDEVRDVVKQFGNGFADVTSDPMNNVYLKHHGNSGRKEKTLMIDSHLDAVGLVVQAVKPNGTIKFVQLGRWVPANLTAEKMRIRNRAGKWITGLVATKPPHFMTEAEKKAPIENDHLVIDVGTNSAEETKQQLLIDTGCPIVPDTQWEYWEQQDVMMGKAFDNRIGTSALLTTMHDLADEKLDYNLIGAVAAQEEVGLRGAEVTIKKVHPDIAICLEGCPADDTFTPEWLIQTGLKRGPMLRDMDTSFIADPEFQAFTVATAEDAGIPYTRAVRTGGGIDGAALQQYQGIPTICIGIPVRYEHTNYGIVAYSDFENTVKLLKALIAALSAEKIAAF